MAYSLCDAAVTPCAQQLGALAGIIDKAAAHCATNKIEESALLQDRLYPDMFCLARQMWTTSASPPPKAASKPD